MPAVGLMWNDSRIRLAVEYSLFCARHLDSTRNHFGLKYVVLGELDELGRYVVLRKNIAVIALPEVFWGRITHKVPSSYVAG